VPIALEIKAAVPGVQGFVVKQGGVSVGAVNGGKADGDQETIGLKAQLPHYFGAVATAGLEGAKMVKVDHFSFILNHDRKGNNSDGGPAGVFENKGEDFNESGGIPHADGNAPGKPGVEGKDKGLGGTCHGRAPWFVLHSGF